MEGFVGRITILRVGSGKALYQSSLSGLIQQPINTTPAIVRPRSLYETHPRSDDAHILLVTGRDKTTFGGVHFFGVAFLDGSGGEASYCTHSPAVRSLDLSSDSVQYSFQ